MVEVPRADWLAEVLSYLNAKYHHQGRSMAGIDCVGPLVCAARKFGIVAADFDVHGYPANPDGSLQPMLDAHLIRKPRSELQLGDVVLNAFRLQPPQHIGIIVEQRYGEWVLLHAHSIAGKVQKERLQYGRYYRYVQGYAVPGVV